MLIQIDRLIFLRTLDQVHVSTFYKNLHFWGYYHIVVSLSTYILAILAKNRQSMFEIYVVHLNIHVII